MTKWRQSLITTTGHGVSVLITLTAWPHNRCLMTVTDSTHQSHLSENRLTAVSASQINVHHGVHETKMPVQYSAKKQI